MLKCSSKSNCYVGEPNKNEFLHVKLLIQILQLFHAYNDYAQFAIYCLNVLFDCLNVFVFMKLLSYK